MEIPDKFKHLKYTLSFLIKKEALYKDKSELQIIDDLCEAFGIKRPMMYHYMNEPKDGKRAELTQSRLIEAANYFGVKMREIYTPEPQQMA